MEKLKRKKVCRQLALNPMRLPEKFFLNILRTLKVQKGEVPIPPTGLRLVLIFPHLQIGHTVPRGFLQHSNWGGREIQGREQEVIARAQNMARSSCSWVKLIKKNYEELVTAAVAGLRRFWSDTQEVSDILGLVKRTFSFLRSFLLVWLHCLHRSLPFILAALVRCLMICGCLLIHEVIKTCKLCVHSTVFVPVVSCRREREAMAIAKVCDMVKGINFQIILFSLNS